MLEFSIEKVFITEQVAYKTIEAENFEEAKKFYKEWNGYYPDKTDGINHENGTEFDTIQCESTGKWRDVSRISNYIPKPKKEPKMPGFTIEKTILIERVLVKKIDAETFEQAKEFYESWDCSDPDSSHDNESELDLEFDDEITCSTEEKKTISEIEI